MSNWMFGAYKTKDVLFYSIIEVRKDMTLKKVFDVQLPVDMERLRRDYKWSNLVQEHIEKDIRVFTDVLPQYMRDICDEHNGISRISNFPNYSIGHIEVTPRSICIGGDNIRLQIAGCDPDDVGTNFTKFFVSGLRGDWVGINFSGFDNPGYREEFDG